MNSRFILLAAVCGLMACGQAHSSASSNSPQDGPALDLLTAFQVVWMYDQEKLAMDLNQQFYDAYGNPAFVTLAISNRRAMDSLVVMIDHYELRGGVFGDPADTPGTYMDERHAQAYGDLLGRGQTSIQEAYMASAYVEEWNILEYEADIEAIRLGQCDPCDPLELLEGTYSVLLDEAYQRFANLASRVDGYNAQLLSQAKVDQILADAKLRAAEGFSINAGLNDAWYDPAKDGQGFFISVFEGRRMVFMSWYTFETETWAQQNSAILGDASQRWLTAQGSYDGAQAELVVFSSGGGAFDSSSPAPSMSSIGSILLQFDDCYTGSVSYDLSAIGKTGTIPIERLVKDNAAVCEFFATSPP